MIDQPTIDRIMDAARIDEVVSEFVTLKKRGVNLVGLCPFHDDKTPSFYVSPSKGLCKCFACGKGGNPVHFIMEHEQLSYPEALRWLAKKYHIEIQERELTDKEKQAQSARESLFVINEFAREYFCNTLHNHIDGKSIGQTYFRSRGIRDDIVRKFHLGYCTSEKDALAREALRKGFKKEYLTQSGVCYEKEDGGIRDRFWGRVIFPWLNISGKTVGFGGRVLDSRTKGVNQKYVNSPESEIFSKRKELYGIYQAKSAIVKKDCVYMVEGYTDVIAMHQCGLENVVANSGTALSEQQIRLLHRFTSNITLLYDGDEAGIKAGIRGIDMFLSEGMNVKVLILPDGEDPDSFARKHSASQFQQYITFHEENFIRFKTRLLLEDTQNDPVKRAGLIADMAHSIGLIPNEIVRYECLKECASILNVSEQVLQNEIKQTVQKRKDEYVVQQEKQKTVKEAAIAVQTEENTKPMHATEKELARMIVLHGEKTVCHVKDDNGEDVAVSVVEYISADLEQDELEFGHPIHRLLLYEAQEHIYDEGFHTERYFLNHPDPTVSQLAADMMNDGHRLSRSNKEAIAKDEERLHELIPYLLIEFKLNVLKEEMDGIMQSLNKPEMKKDMAKTMEAMKRYKELGEIMKEVAKQAGERVMMK